jgi:hypothetical protein
MARLMITKTFTIAAAGYAQPARTIPAGTVVELSAAEQTAVTTAGGTFRATAFRDQLGLAVGVSNSN